MNYECKLCNYSSHDKFNYKRHMNSKRHVEKVIDIPNTNNMTPQTIPDDSAKFTCNYCNMKFTKSCNLSRHKNICSEKEQMIQQLTNRVNELNNKLIEQNKILEKDEEMINILKSEVDHLKSIVNNAGSIIKTSVSTVAYVLKNYKDAPALESVKDYSAIHYKQDNSEFVENLIYEHTHNKLHIYIGDFIIKTYKKEDPSKQSIWNSDTSRLTYLIREIINNNKVDWKIDKKGIKTTKFIIEPILEYIDE